MSQPTVFYRTDMIKSVYNWHPCQLHRLRWQQQTDPQDHGGQGEQEGAKLISGFSLHNDSLTTVGGRSLTLQGNSQVKKRRQIQPYIDLILTFKHLKQPR